MYNRLGTYYVQYSSVKSHLRTASLPKWKNSGIRKGFPTWSRSFLKKRMVFTHHQEEKQEVAFPPLGYLSPLCKESHNVSYPLALTLPSQAALPRRQKQHSSKAAITSFHWPVYMRCALPHSDSTGPKVQQTEPLLVQEMALQTGGDSMFPEQIGTLGCFVGVFVFQARNSVCKLLGNSQALFVRRPGFL